MQAAPDAFRSRYGKLVDFSSERLCVNSLLRWLAPLTIGLFLTSALSRPTQAAPQSPFRWAADVPLLACDGLPCIEALVDGEKVHLLIDTGNQASVLDTVGAKKIGLKPYSPSQPNWPKDIFRATIPSLSIGPLRLSGLRILTMGVSDMIAQNQMPHADGALAYTAFKDRAVQLDFHSRRFRISEVISNAPPCTGACDTFSLITFGKNGPPIIVANGFTINGHPLTAQIDTQYSGSLLVYTASIDKLGLSATAKTTDVTLFPYTDGGVKMKLAPAQNESFHGLSLAASHPLVYFPTAGVHEPDALFDATVGIGLLGDTILTLDFHNSTVSVQKG